MSKEHYMPIDQSLTPMSMNCAQCGGEMVVYPFPMPKGTAYCPNCSPSWVKPFAIWGTNQEREKHGLGII